MLKEENQAEKILTIGGLRVLGKIESAEVSTINKQVSLLQKNSEKLNTQVQSQKDYWTALSDDSVISPIEKPVLKNEYEIIDRNYDNIWTTAEDRGVTGTDAMQEYKTAYENLTEYLLETINLFGDMSESTVIENKTLFNTLYSTYYDKEFKARSLIEQGTASGFQKYDFAIGTKDSHPAEDSELWTNAPSVIPDGSFLWARTAWFSDSVNHGTWTYFRMTGDAAPEVRAEYSKDGDNWHELYVIGDLYLRMSYDAGTTWTDKMKVVGEDAYPQGYLSIINGPSEYPEKFNEQAFFLCGTTYIGKQTLISKDHKFIFASGKKMSVNRTYSKGYIYLLYNGILIKLSDKDDYHYISAANDLLSIGEKLSPAIQDYFDQQLEDLKNQTKDEIAEDITQIVPTYKGTTKDFSTVDMAKIIENDWLLFIGTTTRTYTNGCCYFWKNKKWNLVDPQDAASSYMYMAALYDGVVNNTKTFAPSFATAFVGLNAFLEAVEALHWTMKTGGYFVSKEYDETNGKGFKLNADGTGYFGKKVKIAGELQAATGTFAGKLEAATGKFAGELQAATGSFKGSIEAVNFILTGYLPGEHVVKKLRNPYKASGCGDGKDLLKKYAIYPIGSGSFRIKMDFYKINTSDTTELSYVQINKNDTQVYKAYLKNAGGAGTISQDVAVTDGDEIEIIFNSPNNGGRAIEYSGTPFAITLLSLCLSQANSMFTTLTQITMVEGTNVQQAIIS